MILATAVLATLPPLDARAGPATGSTTLQVDPRHDGHLVGSTITPPLRVAWHVPMRSATVALVADGKVFVSDKGPRQGRRLWAFDASSGRLLWKRRGVVDNWELGGIGYDTGVVVTLPMLPGTKSATIKVRGFDATDGHRLWSVPLIGETYAPTYPVADGGVAYITATRNATTGTLYAIDDHDGRVLWRSTLEHPFGGTPTLSDRRVFVQTECATVQAFARSTGAGAWTYDPSPTCDAAGGSALVLHRGSLYIRAGGRVVLDTRSGAVESTGWHGVVSPVFDRSTIYAATRHGLAATDATSGTVRWRRSTLPLSQPILVDRWVAASYQRGGLVLFRRSDGRVVWRTDRYRPRRPIAVSGGGDRLVVSTRSKLVVFEPAG